MQLSARHTRPLAAILKGVLAGAAGTAAMTAHQELRQRFQRDAEPEGDRGSPKEQADPWESAPAPAQVGRRLIEGVLGQPVPARAIPALTQVMHWSYGSLLGLVYTVGRESLHVRRPLLGPLFGVSAWAASYIQLVALGIYEPPWAYSPTALLDEIGYHLTYGIAAAVSYGALARPAAC
jgi:hypothetical protein